MKPVRTTIAAAALTATASLGLVAPASASPVITGGLGNVTLTNVLNNNLNYNQVQIAVPISAAAAICGVTVNVLSLALAPTGTQTFNCPASTGAQTVTVSG